MLGAKGDINMHDEVLLELRFPSEAKTSLETSAESLKSLDAKIEGTARDPAILAALTIAGAAISLVTELIKLAKELRSRGEKHNILVVKLDDANKEKSISLLEASDEEMKRFIEGD
jgi:hypothetical protein